MSRKPEKEVGGGRVTAPGRLREWVIGLLLLAATLFAYRSVWQAGFIWDDNGHVTRADLRPPGGLWRIWFEPGATQQYYPLLHTVFWLEHRLWADAALGYHLANVVEHAVAAFLLYLILRRLLVPGALFAAAAFALHPVCVESVAWVSEQKNTLSAAFCLGAALAYLRFDRERRRPWYALGVVLFAMALATKSVTATLPAALMVILWWKRGRLSWKGDVLPLAPWLCLSAGAGMMTTWVEKTYIGASGAAFHLGLIDRFLVAGRALWFYLGKVFWPANLIFIYPHWTVDARVGWQYLFPAAAAATLAALFALRARMRGPLATALLFAGTLFPALGFINVYPFVYSFVADHFQYLAAAVVISGAAAVAAAASGRLPRNGRLAATAAAAGLLAVLSWLTARQCATYRDAETLWRTTIARNPQCWMAYENLGGVFMKEDHVDEAMEEFQGALRINRDDVGALNELGVALLRKGRVDQALAQLARALEIAPGKGETHINLGAAFLQGKRPEEAAAQFQQALEIEPGNALVHRDLAAAFAETGRRDDAIAQLRQAAAIEPTDAQVQFELANALLGAGRVDEAVLHFRSAIEINGGYVEAHFNLANTLLQNGRVDEAITHFQRAAELKPEFAEAHDNLAGALLQKGRLDEAATEFQRVLELEPGNAQAHNDLGTVLMQTGRTDEALAHFQRALALKPDFAPAHINLGNFWLKHRRPAQAAADYQRALESDPDNARVHNNLGIALVELGRTDEAAGQFRTALKIDPAYAEAQRNLARVLGPK